MDHEFDGTEDITSAVTRSAVLLAQYRAASTIETRAMLCRFIQAVELQPGQLGIVFDVGLVIAELTGCTLSTGDAANPTPQTVRIECPFSLRRRGVEQRPVLNDRQARPAGRDDPLLSLVLRAHLYLHQLSKGQGRALSDVAALNRTALSEVSRLLPLAFLAPGMTEVILSGTPPEHLTAQRMSRINRPPLSWAQQQKLLAN